MSDETATSSVVFELPKHLIQQLDDLSASKGIHRDCIVAQALSLRLDASFERDRDTGDDEIAERIPD